MKGFVGRTAILVAALVALMGVWTASAQAAFPGENGKIAFGALHGDCGNADDLFVVNPDGSGRTRIGGASGGNPEWSPDGLRIAYVTLAEFGGISVRNADGTGAVNLVPIAEQQTAFNPIWTPDGTKIVFVRAGVSNSYFSMNPDGTGVMPLPLAGSEPFSASGKTVAVTNGGDLFLLNADGSGAKQVTNGLSISGPVDLSPDGTRVLFARRVTAQGPTAIYVMNIDGTAITQLTADPRGDFDPAWSPDGTKIVFVRRVPLDAPFPGIDLDLFVMNADGSGQTNITNTPQYPRCAAATVEHGPDWQPLPFKNAAKKCKALPGSYRNHGQCVKASH